MFVVHSIQNKRLERMTDMEAYFTISKPYDGQEIRRSIHSQRTGAALPGSRRIRLAALLAAATLLFSFCFILHAFAAGGKDSAATLPAAAHAAGGTLASAGETVLYVEPGDTLWEIAERYAPAGSDIRKYIYVLKQRNGLSSSGLAVGQRLVLP